MDAKEFASAYGEAFGPAAGLPLLFWYSDGPVRAVPKVEGCFFKALAECARHYTGKKPVIVSPDIRTGLTMGVPDPHAVGKDRLVDAAYAAANFPLPVVTVDLGTATTFNVVDENKVFRGGVICPGLSTGLRALGERCAAGTSFFA